MISKGRACRGVLHHSVRLTEDQVRQIRVADGTQREIAALFGISQTNVSQIRQRKGWKQLP
jgi:DNA-directed RNA polymerase specialized sigma subunit